MTKGDDGLLKGLSGPYFLIIALITIGMVVWSTIGRSKLRIIAKGSSLITGIITGIVSRYYDPYKDCTRFFLTLNPKYYLAILYPFHLFHEMICFDYHVFVRAWIQIVLLSISIFLITSIITGFFVTYTLINLPVSSPLAIIYGAIVSHTSAYEISIHLESIPRMRHLQTLLKGESICTEPIMMIIFSISTFAYDTNQEKHLDYFLEFLQILCGGMCVGLILGWCLALLMKKSTMDSVRVLLYTILWSFMGYHICSEMGFSAPTAVIAIGWFALSQKEYLGSYIISELTNFWELNLYIAFYLILSIAGINLTEKVINKIEPGDTLIFLVTFLTIYCSRIIALLIMAPILKRIGYGLNMHEAFVIALCATRGGSSLFLAWQMSLSDDETVSYLGVHLFINVSCLLGLTSFMSFFLHPWLFNILGIHGMTAARRNNMNTCMKHINEKTEQFVSVLKMDKTIFIGLYVIAAFLMMIIAYEVLKFLLISFLKHIRFLGDAKWPLVYDVCKLRHPYSMSTSKFADMESNSHDKESNVVICPECLVEIQRQLSIRETAEMIWECRIRILKSKKVSYGKQYENGILMIDAFKILNNAAEAAMDTTEALIKLDELFKMYKLPQETSSRKKKRHLRWLEINQRELKAPRKKLRRICFKLMTHPWFDIVIYLIILCNSCLIIYGEIKSLPPNSTEWYIITSIDFVFLFIYILEFVIKILGYSTRSICHDGFYMYFMSLWNIADFIILLVVCMHASYSICTMFTDCFHEVYSDKLKSSLFVLRLVRLVRLIKIIGVTIQKVRSYKITRINNRIMLAYEIGKGYVAGDEGLEEMIYKTVDNKKIREDCLERIKSDRLAVTRQLGIVQKELPWIANTVKTKQACTVVLSSVKDVVTELKTSGWIDEFEYRKLTSSVAQKISNVGQIKSVVQNTPKELFRETSWIDGDKNLADYLFQNVITKIFDVGDMICQEGEHCNGVYIVISGLVKLAYTPKQSALDAMIHHGILPIVDFINNITYTEKFEEYILSGNTFGELAVLTGRRYNCSIFADTPVQTYVLSKELLASAFDLFYSPVNGLASRMWKTVAVRIGPMILAKVPVFQALSKSAIHYLLAESFVPDISHYKIIVMPSVVEDILLIDGVAQDYHTNFHFKAPCFIPRNVQKMVLPKSSHYSFVANVEAKLLLIPGGEVSHHEVMVQIDSHSEMTPSRAEMNIYYDVNNLRWANYKRQKNAGVTSRKRRYTEHDKSTSSKSTPDYALKQSVSFSIINEASAESDTVEGSENEN